MSDSPAEGTRERILRVAADLLASAGEGFSTRAVCDAAGVGAPTLYHHFRDKQGLLDAVASYGFERYLVTKRAGRVSDDPVADLRAGWDAHLGFGLAYPAFYVLMYGKIRPGARPEAAEEGHRILLGIVQRIADAGLLRVPVELAASMIHAAGIGVTFSLINTPEDERDPELSTRTREAVLAAVTVSPGEDADPLAELRARLATRVPDGLSANEAALLGEWLGRAGS